MSPRHRTCLALAAFGVFSCTAFPARAETRSFVTLRDDGTLAGRVPLDVENTLVKAYDKTGAPRPDVLSVWTTFPMNAYTGPIATETLFDGLSNDVKGIGLETAYPGDGTFTSPFPPVRAILLHNDVTQIAARAAFQNAPVEGFAQYLFLLELLHVWGPAAKVPSPPASKPDELQGIPFHWSFWLTAGSSPGGGNAWVDNHDGTFTVSGQTPAGVRYSMLDLYLMGLADPAEVPPFAILEGATPPSDVLDPFTHKPYAASSFPWFGTTPFTVKATSRAFTIDDVVAANGARSPARSSGDLKLGVILSVAKTATHADVARFEQAFEPIASSLPAAFHAATSGRGTMELTTVHDTSADAGAGASGDDAGTAEDAATGGGATTTTTSGGCTLTPTRTSDGERSSPAPMAAAWTVLALLVRARGRRRRAQRACTKRTGTRTVVA